MPYKTAIGHDPHGSPSVAYWYVDEQISFAFYDAIDELHLCEGYKLSPDEVIEIIERRMADFQRVPGSRESPRHKIWRHYIAAHGPQFLSSVKLGKGLMAEKHMMFSKMSHHGPAGMVALKRARADERVNRIHVSAHSIGGELPTFLADQEGAVYRR